MAATNRNSKASVNRKVKQEESLRLRLRGLSYAKIGAEVGCTKQHAHKLVAAAIKEVETKTFEDAKAVKSMELLRLDKMFLEASRIMTSSQKELNKLSAIDRMAKIMERRSKLLNLDVVPENDSEGIIEAEFL